ncbi:MAG: hypothetical protein FWD16_06130, partial [Clostridia bacterium]|nr:hypothetical protein [Clostridia bacterium]
MTYGILYSNAVQNLIDKATVQQALGGGEFICAEALQNGLLDNIDILVSCLGRYYPEEGFAELYRFYESGGALITFGGQPLTIPYSIKEGVTRIHAETHAALHRLHVIDGYAPTGPILPGYTPTVIGPRFAFLKDFPWPEITQTYTTYYHFAEKGYPNALDFENDAIIDGQAEIGVAWDNAQGRRKAAPLSIIEHYDRGTIVLANFDVEDPAFYSTAAGLQLIKGLSQIPKYGKWLFTARPNYGRYYENETPSIEIELGCLESKAQPGPQNLLITMEVSNAENKNAAIQKYEIECVLTVGQISNATALPDLPEGFYQTTARVFADGTEIINQTNGFYKYSDASVAQILKNFQPITIDPEISPDYPVRNGAPYPLHGANTFVTDVNRECFIKPNPVQADKDFAMLKSVGVNIVRSGTWRWFTTFYDESGNIRETSLRALDVFFLTAARHDLPVQFVPGAFVFNNWDHTQCPIHNPGMRKRVVTAFASLAKKLTHYPNVMIDAINEPSYSLAGWWEPGRPSGDPYELQNWRKWLEHEYAGDIAKLRENRNVGAEEEPVFADAMLPTEFTRRQTQTPHVYARCGGILTDFFKFARDSFSGWVGELRKTVKSISPGTIFMMGRDESLRVPTQQHEAAQGHIDMVNWHQFTHDAAIFPEYMFNRCRGMICCAQELGVHHMTDPRGMEV